MGGAELVVVMCAGGEEGETIEGREPDRRATLVDIVAHCRDFPHSPLAARPTPSLLSLLTRR